MKLLVAVVLLDAVDTGELALDEPVTLHRSDVSVFVQPIAERVTDEGYRTTLRDLMHGAVTQSDSMAVDVLIERLGGPARVNARLQAHGLSGIRLDRDEKHLQSDVAGVTWTSALTAPRAFEDAIAATPRAQRAAAYAAYLRDPRDTSTPRAMVTLLQKLAAGALLSPASTRVLRDTMAATATGAKRLRAGLAPGWRLEHKTGTSSSWAGVTAATNDVGFLVAPDGTTIAVAVFVGRARASEAEREAAIAAVAHAVIASYCAPEARE